jgi:hypothetical protein
VATAPSCFAERASRSEARIHKRKGIKKLLTMIRLLKNVMRTRKTPRTWITEEEEQELQKSQTTNAQEQTISYSSTRPQAHDTSSREIIRSLEF